MLKKISITVFFILFAGVNTQFAAKRRIFFHLFFREAEKIEKFPFFFQELILGWN